MGKERRDWKAESFFPTFLFLVFFFLRQLSHAGRDLEAPGAERFVAADAVCVPLGRFVHPVLKSCPSPSSDVRSRWHRAFAGALVLAGTKGAGISSPGHVSPWRSCTAPQLQRSEEDENRDRRVPEQRPSPSAVRGASFGTATPLGGAMGKVTGASRRPLQNNFHH